MATITLKKGLDIDLKGKIRSNAISDEKPCSIYAIIPDDYPGISPRMEKRVGDTVAAGEPVFHDKDFENIKITSPVCGTIKDIVRGERRKIQAIVIEKHNGGQPISFDTGNDPMELLLKSGLWAALRQRPYDIVPRPDAKPRDIFVTCFDSAPLAPDFEVYYKGKRDLLEKAVEVLDKLTNGRVYLGCRADKKIELKGAVTNVFRGPHPAGNAGVQIANTLPVNKGETVWTLDIVTLLKIGILFTHGTADFSTIVAVTGAEVNEPKYIRATAGCSLSSILAGNISGDGTEKRIINGNVLTGAATPQDGFLRFPFRQVTVIPEILKKDEFMGWASLNPKKFSIYHDFTSWLIGKFNRNLNLDAKFNGSERAIVMSGEYDKMLPMDIYAEYLIKAIIAFDITKMEQLGIYEVAPEDFALAEYADTSKLQLQDIVRQGLDKLRKEMS